MGLTYLMDARQVRDTLVAALEKDDRVDSVQPLGNCVHVHAGDVEFEIVIRTAPPERRWSEAITVL